eukprot:6459584-Amphidinium_carterae.2
MEQVYADEGKFQYGTASSDFAAGSVVDKEMSDGRARQAWRHRTITGQPPHKTITLTKSHVGFLRQETTLESLALMLADFNSCQKHLQCELAELIACEDGRISSL